ncbi:MAG TPA: FKBP-type peptidyl-prolyl cis-trans isomerase [Candidatus Saccharimonadales bacterium]|nr:FKBP-type peptidyl-prolyl cis-trans isomerase [Candidatus Saccharimonadales bacterium]
MRNFLRRFGWVLLALLFVVTALAGGVYAFFQNSGGSSGQSNGYTTCPSKSVTAKQSKINGKVQGAQLAGFTPIAHVGYLQCWDLKTGTGATATPTSTVTATYTGAVASTGKIFQSSLDSGQPFTAKLDSGVIQGWSAGVPGMKVGGTRRLLIPAQYAYGPQGGPGIPPNSDLVFDITLLAVK